MSGLLREALEPDSPTPAETQLADYLVHPESPRAADIRSELGWSGRELERVHGLLAARFRAHERGQLRLELAFRTMAYAADRFG